MHIDLLVVNPDVHGRVRFRQVAAEVPSVRTLHFSSSLAEASQRLKSSQEYDIVMVSNHFEATVANEFIAAGKASTRDCAYLSLLYCAPDRVQDAVRHALTNADGFLVEPFSVDDLRAVLVRSLKVREDRVLARKQGAVRVLVDSVIETLDDAALERKHGASSPAFQRLMSLGKTIHSFSGDLLQYYYGEVVERFGKAEPPAPQPPPNTSQPTQQYTGASQRVRKFVVRSR
jgi:DNA-binding NtrC family response regulator